MASVRGWFHAQRHAGSPGLRVIVVLICGLAGARATSAQPTWIPIGPNGSSLVIFAIAPTTPTTVYAATTAPFGGNGGGLFKSLDGGTTWAALSNDGLPAGLTAINALAINPTVPTTLYAGLIVWRPSQDSPAKSSGVYKSTDGGAHWVNAGLPDDLVYTVVVDPTTPSTIYATYDFRIFKSTDSAATWTQLPYPPFRRATSLVVDPTTPATLYAGCTLSEGVFKSTDGGATWTDANNGMGPFTPSIRALVADPTTQDTLYAAVEGDAVFKTTNGGGLWTAVNPGPDVGDSLALAIAPTTPATLYAGTLADGLFKTTDGGDHWTSVSTGLPNGSIDALAIDPATPTKVYANARYRGVFVTTNGGDAWMLATAGLTNTYVNALVIDPTSPATLYVGTTSLGVFKSTDAGVSWTTVNTGLPITPTRPTGLPQGAEVYTLAIDPARPTTLYVDFVNEGLFRTTDGGTSWRLVADACDPGGICERTFAVAIDPTDSTIYLVKSNRQGGVFKSTNGGDSWTPVITELPGVNNFLHLTIDTTNSRILYLVTDRSLFKSTDGGSNWTALTYLQRLLAIDPSTPTTLYGSNTSVLKSLDGGASWTPMNTGLPTPAPEVRAISIDPASSTLYAATTANGVFRSADGAASWTAVNTGLWPRSTMTLAIAATAPSTVYVGTWGGGVYRLDEFPTFSRQR